METLCRYSWDIPENQKWNSELEKTGWPYSVGRDQDGVYFCDVRVGIKPGITSFALASGTTVEEAISNGLSEAKKMNAEWLK